MSTSNVRARKARKTAGTRTVTAPVTRRGLAMTTRIELEEKVVLLVLTVHAPGNNRRVNDKSILVTEADKELLGITKRLIEAPEHQALNTNTGQIRTWVRNTALPFPLKEGVYAVPLTLRDKVQAKLKEFQLERAELVNAIKPQWERLVAESKRRLGPLADQADYPRAEDLDHAYRIEWQYIALSVPNTGDENFDQQAAEQLNRQWQDAMADFADALRVGLTALVDDMVGRLTAITTGEQKRFAPSKLLERFDEFLATFKDRNVTGDERLDQLAEKARSVLSGVTAEDLKQAAGVRAKVQQGFQQVKAVLDQLDVESKRKRGISFDDV